ncbi:MAG: FliM/FliN family flagellar motor switch protein [Deltaproteobacteria bacterium]|nr:FliM/FliN family flagellar motor switch protein [Deltaproteobacteria bacterium]
MDPNSSTAVLAKVDSGILGQVQDLFRAATRNIRARLVNRSGSDIPVRMAMCELATLGSVMDRLQHQDGGAFVRFELFPGGQAALMVIQGPVLFRLVGLLLGEDPEGKSQMYRWRSLTRLDLRIARRVSEDILEGLTEAFPVHAKAKAVFEMVSASPRVSLSLERSATVIETSLDLGPPEDPFGLVTVVIPAQAASQFWPREVLRRSEERRDPAVGIQRVMPLQVSVVAELARMPMPIGKIRALDVGSEIDLGLVREVKLRVSGQVVMTAEAGEQDGVRSVRIKARVSEDAR